MSVGTTHRRIEDKSLFWRWSDFASRETRRGHADGVADSLELAAGADLELGVSIGPRWKSLCRLKLTGVPCPVPQARYTPLSPGCLTGVTSDWRPRSRGCTRGEAELKRWYRASTARMASRTRVQLSISMAMLVKTGVGRAGQVFRF